MRDCFPIEDEFHVGKMFCGPPQLKTYLSVAVFDFLGSLFRCSFFSQLSIVLVDADTHIIREIRYLGFVFVPVSPADLSLSHICEASLNFTFVILVENLIIGHV